jgi:hypothetical protein
MGERGYDYEYAMIHETDKMAEGTHLIHGGERKGEESSPYSLG